ncbi:hypothetical protein KY290_001914 [Solanum tuberosum]|uniref:Uncharacterized protein n=1 Tax=Solanum tuberosum TaxID=4113 RepID=A0ABQ7WNJ4_SOLTU|nr:hypothetical protein KY290_001914 [Solanum tuberosum]
MSSSSDNSTKMWIFGSSFRSGHSAPPILCVSRSEEHYDYILAADQQSRELSHRHVSKRAKKLKLKKEEIKLKPVIAFDVAEMWLHVIWTPRVLMYGGFKILFLANNFNSMP